jgi:hypothetical protein
MGSFGIGSDPLARTLEEFALRIVKSTAAILLFLSSPVLLWAQAMDPNRVAQAEIADAWSAPVEDATQSTSQAPTPAPAQAPAPSDEKKKDDSEGKQTSRIMWVVPNFAAVSANTQLPPLSAREKFKLGTEDSVDYSSFVWAGFVAAQSMALKSYPELHSGLKGYGRYYWRAFADQASGAFFTEAIVPAVTHEDPRYYTLGHGGFFHRTAYALSRVVITKTDSGGKSFNYSEIVGNGMEAGLSNFYYPPEERGFSKTAQNWGTQLEAAALNNIVKEFWPDIRRHLLRQK